MNERFDLYLSVLQHHHDEAEKWAEGLGPEVPRMIRWTLNAVAQDLGYQLKTTPELAEAMQERWDEMPVNDQDGIGSIKADREQRGNFS